MPYFNNNFCPQGGHREVFEAEFHFEQDENERKGKKKPRLKKPKKAEDEELELKPDVKEMLRNVKPSSSDTDEKIAGSDESDNDGNGTFHDDGFDQSDEEDAEEDIEESTEIKKLENEEKPAKKQEVKLEEDEVKMEVESESEGEEFDGSKMEPENESEDEDLANSDPTDSSVKRKKERKLDKRKQTVKCEICGKCFRAPSDVEKHMVTHTGARDYKCDICTESFPLLNILTR